MKYGMQHYSISNDVKVENDYISNIENRIKYEQDFSRLNEMMFALESYTKVYKDLNTIRDTYSNYKNENDFEVLKKMDKDITSALSNVCGNLYTSRFNKTTCFKNKQEEDKFKLSVNYKLEGLGEIISGIFNFIFKIIAGIFKIIGSIIEGIFSIFTGGTKVTVISISSSGGGGSSSGKSINTYEIAIESSVREWNKEYKKKDIRIEYLEKIVKSDMEVKHHVKEILSIIRDYEWQLSHIFNIKIGKTKVIRNLGENKDTYSEEDKLCKLFVKGGIKTVKELMELKEKSRNKPESFKKSDCSSLIKILDEIQEVDTNDVIKEFKKIKEKVGTESSDKIKEEVKTKLGELKKELYSYSGVLYGLAEGDHNLEQIKTIEEDIDRFENIVQTLRDIIVNGIEGKNIKKNFKESLKHTIDLTTYQHGDDVFGKSCYFSMVNGSDQEDEISRSINVTGTLYYFDNNFSFVSESGVKGKVTILKDTTLYSVSKYLDESINDLDKFGEISQDKLKSIKKSLEDYEKRLNEVKNKIEEKEKELIGKTDEESVALRTYMKDGPMALANIAKFYGKAVQAIGSFSSKMASTKRKSESAIKLINTINEKLGNAGLSDNDAKNIDFSTYERDIEKIL